MEQKKPRRSSARKVPTIKERAAAIDWFKHCCLTKIAVSDSDIYKRFGVCGIVEKLTVGGYIESTKITGRYFWINTENSAETIAGELWKLHGKEKSKPAPAKKVDLFDNDNGQDRPVKIIVSDIANDPETMALVDRANVFIKRYGVTNPIQFFIDFSLGKIN